MKNVVTLATIALGIVLVSGPAFAGLNQVTVPEPLSLSLIAGGIVAIAAFKRIRQK